MESQESGTPLNRGVRVNRVGAQPVAMTDVQQAQTSKPRPSIGRFAGIVALFAVLGPPVGGLVVSALLASLTASSDLAVDGGTERARLFSGMMMLGVVFGLPLSYIVGGVSALLIGAATAAWDARKGTISPYVALGCALVLGGLAALRQGDPAWASEGERIAQLAMLLAHLAAAGLCWLVARTIFGRPAMPSTPGTGGNQ